MLHQRLYPDCSPGCSTNRSSSYQPEPWRKALDTAGKDRPAAVECHRGSLNTHRERGSQHSLGATVDTPLPHSLHTPLSVCLRPCRTCHLPVPHLSISLIQNTCDWKGLGSGLLSSLSLLLWDFGMFSRTAIACSWDSRDHSKERSCTRDLASGNSSPPSLTFLSCCQRGLPSLQTSLCFYCPRAEVPFMFLGFPARWPSNRCL